MKLIIKANEFDDRVIEIERESLYECLCFYMDEAKSKLAGLVEFEAEELFESVSQMYSIEEIAEQAFETVMKRYGCLYEIA